MCPECAQLSKSRCRTLKISPAARTELFSVFFGVLVLEVNTQQFSFVERGQENIVVKYIRLREPKRLTVSYSKQMPFTATHTLEFSMFCLLSLVLLSVFCGAKSRLVIPSWRKTNRLYVKTDRTYGNKIKFSLQSNFIERGCMKCTQTRKHTFSKVPPVSITTQFVF